MDPLSDVLALLKPRSHVSAGFDAGGDWAIAFPANIGIKCYAVVSGGCWLSVDDVAEPLRLSAGDCFLLPSGRPFRLGSDPGVAPVAASTIFPPRQAGGVVQHNGGGDLFLVGSRFYVDDASNAPLGNMLMAMLPPVVHIRKEVEAAALRWCVERMMQELRTQQPGGDLIAQHLAQMMLVQALRLHLNSGNGENGRGENGQGVGWLFALADRQLAAAIGAIHAAPARRWTLQSLAAEAGMSRSVFALRFKQAVGSAPMDYLTRWRMMLAADRLLHSDDPVSVIAPALGYESESAFSTAFKRVMGCAPRKYASGRRRDVGRAADESVEAAA
jgi:AraC-like DNA-binding protein